MELATVHSIKKADNQIIRPLAKWNYPELEVSSKGLWSFQLEDIITTYREIIKNKVGAPPFYSFNTLGFLIPIYASLIIQTEDVILYSLIWLMFLSFSNFASYTEIDGKEKMGKEILISEDRRFILKFVDEQEGVAVETKTSLSKILWLEKELEKKRVELQELQIEATKNNSQEEIEELGRKSLLVQQTLEAIDRVMRVLNKRIKGRINSEKNVDLENEINVLAASIL